MTQATSTESGRTIHIEKDLFIECMEGLGLTRIPSIAALFGKSEQSVYKYMNVDSITQIPNVVAKHLTTIAMIEDENKRRKILETSISSPLPRDVEGTEPYGELLEKHGYKASSDNIAQLFGKSPASIYRAKVRGGKQHDPALAAHLRTLRMLNSKEQKLIIDECFKPSSTIEDA